MEDIGFIGSRFTWKKGIVQERLDRFVCNKDWKDRVKTTRVTHLPCLQSDHNPILLNYNNLCRGNKNQRPFRFLAAWETHENWSSFVQK